MSQVYLLLRNNKEFGPYSLDELAQQQLKPSDLVWIEGKSGGWQHPHSIEELKPYMPNEILPTEISKAAPPQKKNEKHVYVSMPAGVAKKETETKDVQQKTFEERAEKLKQQAAMFSKEELSKTDDDKAEIKTKHAKSLSDLKNEYAVWMDEKKNKKFLKFNKTTAIIAAAALVLIASGFLLSRWLSNNGSNTLLRDAAVTNSMAMPAAQREEIKEDAAIENEPAVKGISKSSVDDAQKEEKPVYKAKNETVKNTTASNNIEKAPAPKQIQNPVPLAQLIEIKGRTFSGQENEGLSKVEVTLTNNSSQVLKVVAVDVLYYDNLKTLLQKRTLYFSNVPAESAVTLKAPGNENATSAHYRLGLVSSDGGSILYSKE